jgi:hypothetical protein
VVNQNKALMLQPKVIDKSPKETREEQRKKMKVVKNKYLNDLQREAEDLPEENVLKKNLKHYYDEEQDEREKMEETYFVRHQPTRKEKKIIKDKLKKSSQREGLGDFTELNNLKGIFGGEQEQNGKKNFRKNRPMPGQEKSKKNKFKKFRK